jgi:ATP-dependent Clp protease, protease subunit
MREQLNQILCRAHRPGATRRSPTDTERDYWMLADEAKEYGVIDGVLTRRELAAVASK